MQRDKQTYIQSSKHKIKLQIDLFEPVVFTTVVKSFHR